MLKSHGLQIRDIVNRNKAKVKTSAFVFVIAFLTTLQLTGNF